MKHLTLLLLLSLLIPATASAAITQAGYYGQTLQLQRSLGACVLDTSRFTAQRNQGTSPTYATAIGNQNNDLYLLADCAGPLAQFASANHTKLIIDLSDILFDPSTNHTLRPDYLMVMLNFYNRAGNNFSATNVITAVILSEAGNSAAGLADVNNAVAAWQTYYPQISTTAGYPMSNGSHPLPAVFPWRLTYVATWDYDTYAPLDPTNGANRGNPIFYDPAAPTSTSTKWGNFLSRLRGTQKVFLLIPGWYGCEQLDNGWARWYMKYVAQGFCQFAQQRPEVQLVTVWLWESYPATPANPPFQCNTGSFAYLLEGTAQLVDTGILPFHAAIFNIAAGTGTTCN